MTTTRGQLRNCQHCGRLLIFDDGVWSHLYNDQPPCEDLEDARRMIREDTE